jgi:hypothetical protein
LFNARIDSSNRYGLYFNGSADQLTSELVLSGTDYNSTTTQVFRDPSAWYHIVVAYDTTQATSSNRVKIYVNGVQVTAFASASYPTQNISTIVNTTNPHQIGSEVGSSFYDGYMAEVNFIDGSALTPSSFGTTDAYGIWQPIPYTGSYGTNGFYLPFTDNSALTTSSNVGLGKDFSGNGNYWVTNNISITAGSTYDSMKDVPTNTNSNTANYATINAVDYNSTYLTLDNGNLHQTYAGVVAAAASRATMTLPTTGKWYWEVYINATGGGSGERIRVGITSPTTAISGNSIDGSATSYLQMSNGQKRTGTTDSTYGAGFSATQYIQVLYDATAGAIYFGQNNSFANGTGSFNQAFSGAVAAFTGLSGELAPCFITYGGADIAVNFGQQPFSYTPPTGFLPLNTYNLPTPTILDGDQYFNATTYTGTGATLAVTNSGSMQPDFVWIKTRNQAGYGHELFDSVRGATKFLISNSTGAESTEATSLTAFNSNGFTVGSWGFINGSGDSEIAWQWRASNAAGVSNTNGTITSTVSVNTTAGFSILTYTGNGSSTATVGHGLGVEPAMLIQYERAGGDWWHIWHTGLSGSSYNVFLNNTEAERASVNDGQIKNNGSSTFAFASTTSNVDAVNENGKSYVVYCFSQVAGYSAFGKYTGNGSDDGPFIYTGFRPRFIFRKCISTSGENSMQYDTSMNPYNAAPEWLSPNTSDASNTAGGYYIDFVSNGVKIRHSATGNNSGRTYIYMAFAENPFKISRAR